MKLKKFISFILGPKKYISKILNYHIDNTLLNEFLLPINKTEPEDIFIVGFPKSGNTWMQSLISGILYGIDTEYLPDKLAQEIVPDVHARKFYKRFGNVNFFKSHSLPDPNYRKVIYLVRDGRDAMVSLYHFNQKLGNNVTLEEMIYEDKHVFPCQWHEHVRQWKENPYNSNILNIRYEDLLTNPLKELKEICKFSNLERSDELLRLVIEGNHIDKMRNRVKETGGMGNHMWTGKKGQDFFRKGKAGTYKTEFTEDLIHFFNNKANEELKSLNYLDLKN